MSLAREWTAFAGGVFALMGTSLAAAARRNAEDALSWERQWREAVGAPPPAPAPDDAARRRGLVLAYRFGGLFFAGIGLGLLWTAASGRAPFAERGGGPDALIGGIFFTAAGAALAYGAWLKGTRRGPRFLDGELLAQDAPLPLGERAARFCGRAMIVLFLAFGIRLLREGLG
ncbi:MAG: hypothetical protein M0D55_02580 [Elusimicrobiota bacterium]|nr:MAG: hypothetical protein M0D55_02580 [Elusimicrobiota bacterium]